MSRGAIAGVVVVLGLALAAVLLVDRSSEPDGPASALLSTTTTVAPPDETPPDLAAAAWQDDVRRAFDPLGAVVPDLVKATTAWREGTRSDDALRTILEAHRPVLTAVATTTADLEPFEPEPLALPLVSASAELYVLVVDLHEAALEVPPGPLRNQVDLLARRARVLADRTFDRGRALLDARNPAIDDPAITLSLPEEVPRWEAEGLAAGPPLAAEPEAAGELYPQREDERPTQSEEAWRAAVDAADAPSPSDVGVALAAGDAATLGQRAGALLIAAEQLRDDADPSGPDGRERSARLRTGLLVLADGARAGQAAALAAGPAAERLSSVAEALVDLAAGPALSADAAR